MQTQEKKVVKLEVSRAHIRQLLDYITITGLPLASLSIRQKTIMVGFHWIYSKNPEVSLVKVIYVDGGICHVLYGKRKVLIELVNDESINAMFVATEIVPDVKTEMLPSVVISALDSYRFLDKYIG